MRTTQKRTRVMNPQFKALKITVYGCPVGAVRTTQRGKWNEDFLRYGQYKGTVVQAFMNAGGSWSSRDNHKPIMYDSTVKPIVAIKCYFANGRHPDCDNVFKAVTDALFCNDTNVVGSMDYDYDQENPRVLIEISYVTAPKIPKKTSNRTRISRC